MSAERSITRTVPRWIAVVAVLSVALVGVRGSPAAVGPLPIAVGATAQGVVGISPGAAVVVCHVAVGANVVGIPVVVRVDELAVFLASNPRDYAGACSEAGGGSPPKGATPGIAVPGKAAVDAGLLAGIGNNVLVVVCAGADGQLFLTPDAAAALVRGDAGVRFGSCAASQGSGNRSGTSGSATRGSSDREGAVFVNGRVSVVAGSLSCDDRLIVTRVKTTPHLVRAKNTNVTTQFVVVNDQGMLVRGATVWIRSTPLDYVLASPKRTTGTDGSVRFSLTTTKHLPLRAGGRLVLFVRATLPGKPLIGCVPGRRLISVRVSTPQS
jgi:hypothetical protein